MEPTEHGGRGGLASNSSSSNNSGRSNSEQYRYFPQPQHPQQRSRGGGRGGGGGGGGSGGGGAGAGDGGGAGAGGGPSALQLVPFEGRALVDGPSPNSNSKEINAGPGQFMGSIAQVDASLSISSTKPGPLAPVSHTFHGALALAAAAAHHQRTNYEDSGPDPVGIPHPSIFGFPQQLHQQHHVAPSNQMGEGMHAAEAPAAGGGSAASESADTYLRKRYREDLFKDEQQEPPQSQQRDGGGGAGGGAASSPTSGSAKSPRAGNGGNELQQQRGQQQAPAATAEGVMGLTRPSNVVPAAAMWAVAAPAPTSGGAFWMLPVNTAGFNTPTVAAAAGPSEASLWTFPTAAGQYRTAIPAAGGSTIPAPLHFMSRINISGGIGALPLGSVLQQQPGVASQHLGMGMSETNLGMLAALNAYNKSGLRPGSAEQNQPLDQHQVQQQHPHGSESAEDHQTSSQ
ncbi:hypothetical protein Taro_042780 [Colocasia esculenta]|uniref:Uncharacterized protein n=1 Tax=Colocasia esculenta TaxID=4460 RepID=A0A843WJ92_COLES|nr:hypothetical protein [Colocasia esculenta]